MADVETLTDEERRRLVVGGFAERTALRIVDDLTERLAAAERKAAVPWTTGVAVDHVPCLRGMQAMLERAQATEARLDAANALLRRARIVVDGKEYDAAEQIQIGRDLDAFLSNQPAAPFEYVGSKRSPLPPAFEAANAARQPAAPLEGHTLCDYEGCSEAPTFTGEHGSVLCPRHAAECYPPPRTEAERAVLDACAALTIDPDGEGTPQGEMWAVAEAEQARREAKP